MKSSTLYSVVNIDALADRVLEKLVARIAGASKPATYSDRKGFGPVGYSDERAKERVRACPHAVKRGRWHVVDREAFEAWERSQLPTVETPRPVSTWTPGGALAESGLRRVK